MKFLVVICSALAFVALAQVFVEAAPVSSSVSGAGKAAVDACSSLNLSSDIKDKVSKAVDDAIASAQKDGGDNVEIAKKGLRAAGQTLDGAKVQGMTDELEKKVQSAIEGALKSGSSAAVPASLTGDAPVSISTTDKPASSSVSPAKSRRRRHSGNGGGFSGFDDHYGPISSEPTSSHSSSSGSEPGPMVFSPAAM